MSKRKPENNANGNRKNGVVVTGRQKLKPSKGKASKADSGIGE